MGNDPSIVDVDEDEDDEDDEDDKDDEDDDDDDFELPLKKWFSIAMLHN